MSCPGYCGDCLRPDWRFGIPGQRQYSMELRERASSTPRQTPNLSTSPFSSNNARATAPVTGRDTRYGALHPLWAAAPDQKGCTAYGSGAAHPITRTNAESARRRPTQQREDRCTRYGPRHPLRGATPVMSRCTRYEPLHPIRRGALPTDRVQRTQSQEQTRNLRDNRRHAEGR